ncbi:hypothetical protein [Flavobacterium sp. PL02]|uniref:hypothetical protein n=1 Tax=Flavobacterium sp. PL02 TaxID=3088354 RepID=UPI002B226573|nr:hypothetical protein [Flavobacterium sp. PL02]MEA9412209.1 hypothetical protein [Flavobacterium sp. PL02]
MKKTTLGILLIALPMLFINCSKDESSTVPSPQTVQTPDPRLPNQEVFKPAIQLVPKSLTGKVTGKSTATKQRIVKELIFRVTKDQLGNEVQNELKENRYLYDSKGRLYSIDRYIKDKFIGIISKYEFDAADKVTKAFHGNTPVEINSGGYITKTTGNDGGIMDIYYDEIGRLAKEVETGTYEQEIEHQGPDGNYTYETVTNPKTATYLYNYVDNKVFVNILLTEKNYSTAKETPTGIEYIIKDKITEITYELTIDYAKAGIYSSEPIFRCYIYNWMHILDWKVKAVSEGVTEYELRYDYEYVYDSNGYLKESKQTTTRASQPDHPLVMKTLYTYE